MDMRWLAGLVGLVMATSPAKAQPGAAGPGGPPPDVVPPVSASPPGAPPPGEAPPANPSPVPDLELSPPSLQPIRPWSVLAPPGGASMAYPPPAEQAVLESYRWQIFAADAASIALALSANETIVSAAALTYLLGGPLIHGVHGEGGRAAGSLALRLGMPFVGALVGEALGRSGRSSCTGANDICDDDDGALVGGILGFGAGVLTAMVIDTAVIARPVAVRRTTGVTWAPQIGVTSQHARLGIVGRF